MTITLRPIQLEADAAQIVRLLNTVNSEPTTAEHYIEQESEIPAGTIYQQIGAVDPDDTMVGFYDIWHLPWMPEGEFGLKLLVDPARRGSGIGSRLYDSALAFGQAHGAAKLRSNVRENAPDGRRFAEQRGFQLDRHVFESTIQLADFDLRPFSPAIAAAEATGIRFLTLADAGDTPEARRKVYDLNRRVAADIPGDDGTFFPFEEFEKMICGAFWYRPEGIFLAADGDAWVGLAMVGTFPETNSMYNMITGVEATYRGRGIAQALKVLSIRYAQQAGAAYIRTNNDSQNAPMLAINRKLGYQPQPGLYGMIREFSA
jgi:GNAT superfamily N-acetyltransferase